MYSPTGSYIAIAGIVVSILGHFNINATTDNIAQIIGAGVLIWGIVQQFVSHRKLAQSVGALPPKV